MTDIAVKAIPTSELGKLADPAFRAATLVFALLVLVILGGVIVSLAEGAVAALDAFASGSWNSVTEKFGALAPVYGRLVTSATTMLIGIPVAFNVGARRLASWSSFAR